MVRYLEIKPPPEDLRRALLEATRVEVLRDLLGKAGLPMPTPEGVPLPAAA
jgi:hypothetical protein